MAKSNVEKYGDVPSSHEVTLPVRARWARSFAAADRLELENLVEVLKDSYSVRSISPAVSGLGMLQIADSVSGDGFHLGEFTLATASVELTDVNGNQISGGAAIMADDEDLVHSLAILDAVLAARSAGFKQVETLLLQGQMVLEDEDKRRKQILASTSVDFSTLDEAS